MATTPPGQLPPGPSDHHDDVSVDDLADDLRAVVRTGLDQARPADLPRLLALRCVTERAHDAGYPDNPDGARLALRDVITDALRALGPGPTGDATRLLFGTVADTRARPLPHRRRVAADALDVAPSTFRKNYQARLVHEVAAELARIERHPKPAAVGHPDTPDTPDDDAAEETQPAPEQLPAVELHAVHDVPAPSVEALRVSAPEHDLPQTAGSRRVEWLLLAPLVAGAVWWRWGLDALLWVVAFGLFAGLVATVAGAVRDWVAGGAARALLVRTPRLVFLGAAEVFVVGAIAASADSDERRSRTDPCLGLDPAPSCTTTTEAATPAEVSPNSVPTADAVPAAAVGPECPPPGNTERRLSFLHGPPLCIDRSANYVATVATNFGEFRIWLNTHEAPWTVNNFVFLARWRFFDGVSLAPYPEPQLAATSMLTGDPVAPEHVDQAPGYGLTFDRTTYPHSRETVAWVTMTDIYHPNRWAVVLTKGGHDEVELNPARWPRLGQIACGVDVIADDSPGGGLRPGYTSAPVVIETVTIQELPINAVTDLTPRGTCG